MEAASDEYIAHGRQMNTYLEGRDAARREAVDAGIHAETSRTASLVAKRLHSNLAAETAVVEARELVVATGDAVVIRGQKRARDQDTADAESVANRATVYHHRVAHETAIADLVTTTAAKVGANAVFDKAKAAMDVANAVFDKAKAAMDVANAVFDKAKAAMDVAIKVEREAKDAVGRVCDIESSAKSAADLVLDNHNRALADLIAAAKAAKAKASDTSDVWVATSAAYVLGTFTDVENEKGNRLPPLRDDNDDDDTLIPETQSPRRGNRLKFPSVKLEPPYQD
jgi:hypothetical protein